jgi:hypothetical protein
MRFIQVHHVDIIHIYIHTYMYTYIYIYMYNYVYIYIRIYIYGLLPGYIWTYLDHRIPTLGNHTCLHCGQDSSLSAPGLVKTNQWKLAWHFLWVTMELIDMNQLRASVIVQHWLKQQIWSPPVAQ